jgi:uncharacterized OB-fold protein
MVISTMSVSMARAADPAAPESEASSPVSRPASIAEFQHLDWWVYASGLLLGALMFAGYLLYRVHDDRQHDPRRGDPMPTDPSSPETATAPAGDAAAWAGESGEHALYSIESVERHHADDSGGWTSEQRTPTPSDRVCPDCGERYAPPMLVCPDDATPLKRIDSTSNGPDPERDETSDRRRCPGCERRYESDASYCYHDGIRLVADTLDRTEEAPVYRVCETCGFETDRDRRLCPRDGSELLTVDPSHERSPTPTVPYAMCPECGETAPPGRARCPEDDHVLTPICHTRTRALSSTGFGPPRNICRECGETYSSAASYCSVDGTELMSMN